MLKVHRLIEILYSYNKLIQPIIDENNYDNFITKVIDEYRTLYNEEVNIILNNQHLPYAITSVALYKVFLREYSLNSEAAIELIYTMTYRATESIFDDLSFVQLAYYVICNKAFLRQIILRSLSEFDASDLEDCLEEHTMDCILDKDLIDTNIKDYFNRQKVPELNELLKRVDNIIEEFVDIHFTKQQKSFTLEDIL